MATKKTRKSARTTAGAVEVVVLLDNAGNYYELSRETLESSRVPDDEVDCLKEKLENVVGMSGYINIPFIPGSIVATFVLPAAALQHVGTYRKKSKKR